MNVQLNPLEEIGLVAAREVRKNLRSVKGLALAVLTVGGGAGIMALLLPKLHEFDQHWIERAPDALTRVREEAIGTYANDPAAGHALSSAPTAILMLTLLTLSLTPAYMAMTGFDVVSSDLQHRAVRYWTVRLRRASYICGKFLGLWMVASAIVLLLHLVVWIMLVARGEATFADSFTWGGRLFAAWLPIAAVWSAISVLIGGTINRPFLSLIAIFGAVFVLWAGSHIGPFFKLTALMYIWPNEYLTLIAGGDPKTMAEGLGLAVAFVISALGASVTLFSRRDV